MTTGHGQDRRPHGIQEPDALSYEAYRAARERFLARLRADSEISRLEAAWRQEPPVAADRPVWGSDR